MNLVLCGFNVAWKGPCQNPQPCDEHMDKVCRSCGKAATRSCDSTGQFVCGAPLCDECEHLIFPEGDNGGIGFNEQPLPEGFKKRHVKKTEQVFAPWYAREEEANK